MSRAFTLSRMRQGFVSAKHWQAFLDVQDHTAACPACQGEGAPMELGDGSLQPTARRCQQAVNLDAAYRAVGDSERREMARVQEIVRRRRLRP